MLSKKSKGYFVELSAGTFTVARTSAASAPFVIEEVRSCSAEKSGEITTLLAELQPKRSGAGKYVHAVCGVYPPSGMVRRAVIDPKRLEEAAYLEEAAASNCRITPSEYLLSALSTQSGLDLGALSAPEKEILFAGISLADVSAVQKQFLSQGIFPDRLELGTVAVLGAVADYRAYAKVDAPTLVLEVKDQTIESFVVGDKGVEASRPVSQGIEAMIPIIQKELGLKDEESARRLFLSNTFDFTGMASAFTKKLIKELQSSIGFYEVHTGQSIGQVLCTLLPTKLAWLQGAIATQLGVDSMKIDFEPWLKSRDILLSASAQKQFAANPAILGIVSLLLEHRHAAVQEA